MASRIKYTEMVFVKKELRYFDDCYLVKKME